MPTTLLAAAKSTAYVDWGALGKIVVVSLLAGAGLTAVFSIGLLALNLAGYGGTEKAAKNPLILLGAVLCFMVVLAGVGWGIDTMLAK